MRFLLYFLFTSLLLSKVYAQSKEDFFTLEKKIKETKNETLKVDIYLQLAQLWLELDLNKAEEYAKQARKIAQDNDLPTQTAHMTLMWGQIYRVQLKYKEAQQNLELAYQLFKRRQDKRNAYKTLEELALFNSDKGYNKKADSLFSIVQAYCKQEPDEEMLLTLNTFHIGIHLLRQGKFTKAIHQLEQVLDLYEKQGNYFMQGKTQNAIGLCYKNLSFQRLALEHYVQALKLYEKMGFSHKNMVTTLINIGNIYVDWNDNSQFAIAEKYYLQAKQLAEEQKDVLKHIASLNALARLRKKERKYQQALTYLDTANIIAIKNQVYLEIGKIKYQRADIYRLLQQYKKSETELEQALELYKSNESDKDKLYAKFFLGHLYKEKRDYITALQHYQAYLQIAKEGDFYLEVGHAYYYLAETYLLLNECDKVMEYAQMSIKHGEHYASQQYRKDGFLYAAKADSCRGNYKQAFYWFTRYNDFKDSLTNKKRYQETQEIQALYDYEVYKK
jgi:tetratricopeptide (TPR) repeat protein